MVWCSTRCMIWRELGLKVRGRVLELRATQCKRRNGSDRPAGARRPDVGGRCWRRIWGEHQ